MARRHYQTIILGDSLAARLAGALLAKRGCRILFLQDGTIQGSWFHSSWLLEKLLEEFAGRSCYAAPVPFQVITNDSRLELQGDSPLEEELRREFPTSHGRVSTALHRLAETGEQLESLLWEDTLLPIFGFSSRLAFAWKSVRRRVRSLLNQPLHTFFSDLRNDSSWPALNALFSALALAPADRLSAAEGALLWSACSRSRSISLTGLDALLRHRFEQFNGEGAELAKVLRVQCPSSGPATVILKDGGECSADHLLLGNAEAFALLPEENRRKLPPAFLPDIFSVTVPEGLTSPLLAPRIILDGAPPLRVSLVAREGKVHGTIESFRIEGATPLEAAGVGKRLAALFPFAGFDPVLQKEGIPAPRQQPKPAFPAPAGLQRAGCGVLVCHGGSLFPALGAAGEVMIGFSTARFLTRRLRLGG